MTPIFLAAAAVALTVALSLMLWLAQRRHNASIRLLRQAAAKLPALDAQDEKQNMGLPEAIDEMLHATSEVGRTVRRAAISAGITLLLLVALAAMTTYRGANSPHADHFGTTAHADVASGSAPPINHGVDMQAAIAKLSEKLRQHPDDAEGWALLGRTYKAMQQYPEAREAFRHAVAAAPGDTDLAQEYAAAETPNPEPATTDSTQAALDPKFQEGLSKGTRSLR